MQFQENVTIFNTRSYDMLILYYIPFFTHIYIDDRFFIHNWKNFLICRVVCDLFTITKFLKFIYICTNLSCFSLKSTKKLESIEQIYKNVSTIRAIESKLPDKLMDARSNTQTCL